MRYDKLPVYGAQGDILGGIIPGEKIMYPGRFVMGDVHA
jgi:hypothetical protein